jgi:hypothetical protein
MRQHAARSAQRTASGSACANTQWCTLMIRFMQPFYGRPCFSPHLHDAALLAPQRGHMTWAEQCSKT